MGRARPRSTSARTLRWSLAAWVGVAAAVLLLLALAFADDFGHGEDEDPTKLPAPPRPVRARGTSDEDVVVVVVVAGECWLAGGGGGGCVDEPLLAWCGVAVLYHLVCVSKSLNSRAGGSTVAVAVVYVAAVFDEGVPAGTTYSPTAPSLADDEALTVLWKVPVCASSAGEYVLPAPPRPEWAKGGGGEVVVRMGTMEPVREARRCCDAMFSATFLLCSSWAS